MLKTLSYFYVAYINESVPHSLKRFPTGLLMTIIKPLQNNFTAQINGVDLARSIEEKTFVDIQKALHEFGVIHFPKQKLSPSTLSSFTKLWGKPDVHHLAEHTFPEHPEVRVLSNVKKAGKLVGAFRGGNFWHSDLSYLKKTGYVTLLYGIECPSEGGDTLFADMRRLYDSLPNRIRIQIEGKMAVHDRSYRYSALYPERPPLTKSQLAKVPPVEHPAVITHPVTEEKSVFLYKEIIRTIGELDQETTWSLMEEIESLLDNENFVYRHEWKPGDLVIWDNRCTLHSATPYDSAKFRRVLYRTQVSGEVPAYVA